MVANPVQPIASLPIYILSFLDLASSRTQDVEQYDLDRASVASSTKQTMQRSPLLRLPPEMVEEIVDYLDFESVFALRLSCFGLAQRINLSQRFWFKHFFEDNLFGFFFVFDANNVLVEIYNRVVKRHKTPPRWDWMALIRRLAEYSSFENDGVFHNAPPGFRNRRRIWKILETIETYENDATTKGINRTESSKLRWKAGKSNPSSYDGEYLVNE